MIKTRQLTGIQTSGGTGSRARPLNLYSATSMIPKSLLRMLEIPIGEIQLEQFKDFGIDTIHILTQHLENREHLSNRFGDGSKLGLNIYYSDPHDDPVNNGSGDAILTNLEKRALTGDSIILSNDNLFEFDCDTVLDEHRKNGSIISVMSILTKPRNAIKNYGLINSDPYHKIINLGEKPDNEKEVMRELNMTDSSALDGIRVPINTAGYIVDNDALSKILKESWVIKKRRKSSGVFDMAGNLIKELIKRKYPVHNIPIDAWGDLGSTTFFLDTFPEALSGKFPFIYKILERRGYHHIALDNVWIHPDSLNKKDKNGRTLEERMERGEVKIGPNVTIGRDATFEEGVNVRFSEIGKYGKVEEGGRLDRAYLSPYCRVGPHAVLRECALGLQVNVDSSKNLPTYINGRSVFGPKIYVPKDTKLENVQVYPGYKFGGEGELHTHKILKPTLKQLAQEVRKYQEPKES